MKRHLRSLSFVALLGSCLLAHAVEDRQLAGLKWRNLGPFRGGRVTAVAGAVGQSGTFYMGTPQGGVWKTTSAGQVWDQVFDSVKETSTIGAIAVSASNPDTIYVGTGEIPTNNEGWGVYKSIDAGKSWQHLGLEDARIIPAVLVDPKDPNLVLVASRGSAKTKEQRGVYRSTDGGAHWDRTLFVDNTIGVVHMASAYDHPETIIAGTSDGKSGDKCKIYKSTDEGKTWTPLEGKGLPKLRGRYSLAVAQNTNAQRMFVIGQFGLYRTDDGGLNWYQVAQNDHRIANGQGNYSCGVFVDTQNPDIVYTVATCVFRSLDGGKNFAGFKGAPGGDDPHFMWIDPTNGSRILLGGDQGATVSLDAGAHWGLWYNQPTAQVYHICADNSYPYWVYATQQDSGVVGTASRGNLGQITMLDWTPHAGFEFGYVVIDPLNPKISYALGMSLGICRFTNPSGQWVDAGPAAEPGETLRSFINTPLAFNPNNPHELLAGYQYLMSTTDGGQSWHKLGPDLANKVTPAKDPKDKPREDKGIINSFSVSTVDKGVIWVGTSVGLIQVTQNGGRDWTPVKGGGLPDKYNVSCIEASHHNPAEAYVVLTNNNVSGVYKTTDLGSNWTPLSKAVPAVGSEPHTFNVIRCDTQRNGLLFLGTDKHLFVSFDDGSHWQSLMLNMPTTIMNDLLVKDNDLIVGTYGRGLWVLDDISPLRQLSSTDVSENVHLYKPSVGVRVRKNVNGDTPLPPEVPRAANPPAGVCLYYSLATEPKSPVRIEIVDENGEVVRYLTSAAPVPYDDPAPEIATYWPGKREQLPASIGLNRANWDIRYDLPPAWIHDVQDVMQAVPHEVTEATEGPIALPGKYTVRLTVDGTTVTQPLVIVNDPRSPAKDRDLVGLHKVEMDSLACIKAGYSARKSVTAERLALGDATKSSIKEVASAAQDLDKKLEVLEGKITYNRRFFLSPNATNFVDLNLYQLSLLGNYATGDAPATEKNLESYAGSYYLTTDLIGKVQELNGKPLADLNALLAKNGLKQIQPAVLQTELPLPDKRFRRKPGVKAATPGKVIDPEALERKGGYEEGDDDNDGI